MLFLVEKFGVCIENQTRAHKHPNGFRSVVNRKPKSNFDVFILYTFLLIKICAYSNVTIKQTVVADFNRSYVHKYFDSESY